MRGITAPPIIDMTTIDPAVCVSLPIPLMVNPKLVGHPGAIQKLIVVNVAIAMIPELIIAIANKNTASRANMLNNLAGVIFFIKNVDTTFPNA